MVPKPPGTAGSIKLQRTDSLDTFREMPLGGGKAGCPAGQAVTLRHSEALPFANHRLERGRRERGFGVWGRGGGSPETPPRGRMFEDVSRSLDDRPQGPWPQLISAPCPAGFQLAGLFIIASARYEASKGRSHLLLKLASCSSQNKGEASTSLIQNSPFF